MDEGGKLGKTKVFHMTYVGDLFRNEMYRILCILVKMSYSNDKILSCRFSEVSLVLFYIFLLYGFCTDLFYNFTK